MGDQTVVQMREVRKGVGAAGNIVERYMIRVLGPIGKKIAQASKAGRIMALLGVVTVIVSLALILTDATWFRMSERRGRQFVNITYEQKGYGIVFLAGLGLYVVGVMQRRGNNFLSQRQISPGARSSDRALFLRENRQRYNDKVKAC